jgi:threonylcarbamoyladenosine tRNA methylthiotransferase MtaB
VRVGGLRARGYVEIQNGCDHRCTFCIIPFGRGNSRSIAPERVVAEVRGLARAGYAEVVLTGVDLTSWGADLTGAPALGALVRRILAGVPELPRLRLSSIDAAEIDPELMAALADEPRLCPHLHLSLQSGDDLILKRMKRRHSSADALALIEAVRRVRPETAFGADLIAGFPTETERAFANTMAFAEAAGLAWLHVFPYSPRPGTPAARMPLVAKDIVKERAARLRAVGAALLERHLASQVGRRVEALVERDGRARAADFTEIGFSGVAEVGRLVSLTITGHDGRQAIGALA